MSTVCCSFGVVKGRSCLQAVRRAAAPHKVQVIQGCLVGPGAEVLLKVAVAGQRAHADGDFHVVDGHVALTGAADGANKRSLVRQK